MATHFGQVVVGPPGSGKTTYCDAMAKLLTELGRKVAVVNLDPANETSGRENPWAVDVMDLISVEDVMDNFKLGPNGALVYSMEFLKTNIDWLIRQMNAFRDHYFLFDCPGQVELYTHHDTMRFILERLEKERYRLCVVELVDSHYCNDPGKYIATLLMSLSSMLNLGMPHINVLSKIDLAQRHSDKLQFGLDFYTEVLDLGHLLKALNEDIITKKYAKLNEAIVELVENHSLVSFLPLAINNKKTMLDVKAAADKANGYVFDTGEEQSIQKLLACAMGVNPCPVSLDDQFESADSTVNQSEQLLWQ